MHKPNFKLPSLKLYNFPPDNLTNFITCHLINFLLLPLCVLLFSCSNSTEPEEWNPASLHWSIDTLQYPSPGTGLSLSSFSGRDISDVFLVGHCSASNGGVWRYNGYKWSMFPDQINKSVWPHKVISLENGENWITGELTHYKNTQEGSIRVKELLLARIIENQYEFYPVELSSGGMSIYADSKDNIWIGCRNGHIVKFKDGNYEISQLQPPNNGGPDFMVYGFWEDNNTMYLLSKELTPTKNSFNIFRLESGKWENVDSYFVEAGKDTYKWGSWGLKSYDNYGVYSFGLGGVYKWDGKEWQNIFFDWIRIQDIWVFDENNILAVGDFVVYHYNGLSWNSVKEVQYSYLPYSGIWSNGKETLISAYEPGRTIIFHGK